MFEQYTLSELLLLKKAAEESGNFPYLREGLILEIYSRLKELDELCYANHAYVAYMNKPARKE